MDVRKSEAAKVKQLKRYQAADFLTKQKITAGRYHYQGEGRTGRLSTLVGNRKENSRLASGSFRFLPGETKNQGKPLDKLSEVW